MLTIDLLYVGTFLNPYLLGEVCLHDDANVKEALNRVLQKIACTPIAYLRDFANFVKIRGLFFNTPLMKDLNLLRHEWWDLIGANGHTFAPITCHILPRMCLHHRVSRIGIYIHLSIAKCEIG
jgi:hypothetical protein